MQFAGKVPGGGHATGHTARAIPGARGGGAMERLYCNAHTVCCGHKSAVWFFQRGLSRGFLIRAGKPIEVCDGVRGSWSSSILLYDS